MFHWIAKLLTFNHTEITFSCHNRWISCLIFARFDSLNWALNQISPPPRLSCTCSYLARFINQPFWADVALRFSLNSGCRFDWQLMRQRVSCQQPTNTHTPHATPTYKHAHSWSGLAQDNGIRDHHLPLLSRHLILPTLLRSFCLSLPYCPLSLSSLPSDSSNVRAPLSLTFLAVSKQPGALSLQNW